jgi:hypothetical protein
VTERVKHARLLRTQPEPFLLTDTMDLRRLAQANAMASPRRYSAPLNHPTLNSTTTTPPSASAHPVTSRPRISYPITRSPLESPSISASLPFDWEAARGLRDPPYSLLSPKRRSVRNSDIGTPNAKASPTKQRAVRKKSFYEK